MTLALPSLESLSRRVLGPGLAVPHTDNIGGALKTSACLLAQDLDAAK